MMAFFDQRSNNMSHYFHIKKKSIIIISIVLVKFLNWFHQRDATTIRAQRTSACVTRDSLRKLQFSRFTPKNPLNLHIQSLGDQWLQFALASIFPLRWVVCCVFTDCGFYIINILNQRFYRTTFVRYLFAFSDPRYIKYKMELRYILIPAKTRKTTLES